MWLRIDWDKSVSPKHIRHSHYLIWLSAPPLPLSPSSAPMLFRIFTEKNHLMKKIDIHCSYPPIIMNSLLILYTSLSSIPERRGYNVVVSDAFGLNIIEICFLNEYLFCDIFFLPINALLVSLFNEFLLYFISLFFSLIYFLIHFSSHLFWYRNLNKIW